MGEQVATLKDWPLLNSIQIGDFRVLTSLDGKKRVLVEVTRFRREEGGGLLVGDCVLTGDEWIQGLWTDEMIAQVGPAFAEMEVLAWMAKE